MPPLRIEEVPARQIEHHVFPLGTCPNPDTLSKMSPTQFSVGRAAVRACRGMEIDERIDAVRREPGQRAVAAGELIALLRCRVGVAEGCRHGRRQRRRSHEGKPMDADGIVAVGGDGVAGIGAVVDVDDEVGRRCGRSQ